MEPTTAGSLVYPGTCSTSQWKSSQCRTNEMMKAPFGQAEQEADALWGRPLKSYMPQTLPLPTQE